MFIQNSTCTNKIRLAPSVLIGLVLFPLELMLTLSDALLAGYKAQGPDMFPAVTLPQCSDMTCPVHLWYLHLAAAQKLRQPEEILTCNLSASEIWARTFCGLHYYNWEIPWSLDLYFPFKFHSFLTDQNPLTKFIKALHYFCIFYLFLAQCLKTSDKSCMTHAPSYLETPLKSDCIQGNDVWIHAPLPRVPCICMYRMYDTNIKHSIHSIMYSSHEKLYTT